MRKMSLKQRQWAVAAVLAAGMGLIFWGVFSGRGWMEFLGFVGLLLGFAEDLRLLRCPRCGAWLGRYPGRCCGSCGEKIDWNGKKSD